MYSVPSSVYCQFSFDFIFIVEMFWFTTEISFLYIVKMCTAEISLLPKCVLSLFLLPVEFTAEISFLYIVSSVLVGVKM
jgi:hypothetical protein